MAAQAATATPQQLFEMQHQSMQLMLYMQQVAFAQLNPMAMHMQMTDFVTR